MLRNQVDIEDEAERIAPARSFVLRVPWLTLAYMFCVLFGLFLVGIVHELGDGGWFWYSVLSRNGSHLYSDLHLPLQPLLPLEFRTFQQLFGIRWLPSQLLGIFNVLAFAGGLFWVARFSRWPRWQTALVSVCAFVVTTDFVTFRFDDYHVISAALVIYSIGCLLQIDATPQQANYPLLVVLGMLSGICFTNRMNDGAALFGAVVVCLLVLRKSRRILSVLAVTAAAAVSAVLVVLCTGDKISAWWTNAVTGAASIKGGTGRVLLYPFHLPANTVRLLLGEEKLHAISGLFSIAFLFAIFVAYRRSRRRDGTVNRGWTALLGALLLIGFVLRHRIFRTENTRSLVEVLVLASILLFAYVLVRLVRRMIAGNIDESHLEVLLLIPMGQLVSIAMSSGKWYPNAFPPIAQFLIVLMVAAPFRFDVYWRKAAYMSLVLVLGGGALMEKIHVPFFWWSYKSGDTSIPRVWYSHRQYGPMWIEARQLDFIEPVCSIVESERSPHELLSLPFPYANYFCAIPPWHRYVQTWFDTTRDDTMDRLVSELKSEPPKWIFYQRQPYALHAHEGAFLNGMASRHRMLDDLIMAKIAEGVWRLVYLGPTPGLGTSEVVHSDWMLIDTSAVQSNRSAPNAAPESIERNPASSRY